MDPATDNESRFVSVAGKGRWMIAGAIYLLANLAQLTGYTLRDIPELFRDEPVGRFELMQKYTASRGIPQYRTLENANDNTQVGSANRKFTKDE